MSSQTRDLSSLGFGFCEGFPPWIPRTTVCQMNEPKLDSALLDLECEEDDLKCGYKSNSVGFWLARAALRRHLTGNTWGSGPGDPPSLWSRYRNMIWLYGWFLLVLWHSSKIIKVKTDSEGMAPSLRLFTRIWGVRMMMSLFSIMSFTETLSAVAPETPATLYLGNDRNPLLPTAMWTRKQRWNARSEQQLTKLLLSPKEYNQGVV